MKDTATSPNVGEIGPVKAQQLRVAGIDPSLAAQCSSTDIHNLLGSFWLQCASFVVDATAMSVSSIALFAHGNVLLYPFCIFGSAAAAGIIALLDHVGVVVPALWDAAWRELERGGLVQPRSVGAIFHKGAVVLVRLIAGVAISQVVTFACLVPMFGADTQNRIVSDWQQKMLPIYSAATERVDAEIASADEAVTKQAAVVAADRDLRTATQKTILDPVANAPDVASANDEVAKAAEARAKAQSDALAAKQYAADEMAGVTREGSDHSGKPGQGWVYRGAAAKEKAAVQQSAASDLALSEARRRLEQAKSAAASTAPARQAEARQQLPDVEASVQRDTTELSVRQSHLVQLRQNRDQAIESEAEATAGFQPLDDGLLNQARVLKEITDEDPFDRYTVGVFEAGSLVVELGLVLLRAFIKVPSRIASLLGRDAYVNAIERVREIEAAMHEEPADGPSGSGGSRGSGSLPPDDGIVRTGGLPRRRGRPPKSMN